MVFGRLGMCIVGVGDMVIVKFGEIVGWEK